MGYLRIWRRFKVAPGITLNLGKRGISTSLGVRGAHLTFGRHGIRRTVGIPGTGVYYTSLHRPSRHGAPPLGVAPQRAGCGCGGIAWLWLLVAIVVVAIVALAGSQKPAASAPDPTPTPTMPTPGPTPLFGAPEATPAHTPTLAVQATPTATPAPTPTPLVLTRITLVTSPVRHGSTATLAAVAGPGITCSITVLYRSGPSEAAGLVAKVTDAHGHVSWTWSVGTRTAPGTYPIIVTCGADGTATVSFTVT